MSAASVQVVGRLPPPDGPLPVEAPQRRRLREEVEYLLTRLAEQSSGDAAHRARVRAELRWWHDSHRRPLVECVQRGFVVRQLCLRLVDSDGSWRNAISYIGDLDPRDATVCSYDYDRAEIRFPVTSSLASPYGWTDALGAEVSTWYARTGMSAITAWLIAT